MKAFTSIGTQQVLRYLCAALAAVALPGAYIFFGHQISVVKADGDPPTAESTFSNTTAIAPVDRASNSAGTNPGLPALYPSVINVTGKTGNITKVTVSFSVTSTFPDDLDVLLVHPNGTARTLLISDGGGSGNITNRAFVFDQAAATAFPDAGTDAAPVPAGTYQPSNFAGLATPEPGGQDNFPAPGPGLTAFPAPTLNVFNGLSPNGNWSLYVVDDQVLDTNSLPGGWSITITTDGGGGGSDAPVDMDGDGTTDHVVARNTGGGPSGQVTWFSNLSGGGSQINAWGLASDFFVPGDFDGDDKDDVAIWRPGAPLTAGFYILQSSTSTLRSEAFGQTGDDPTVVSDYNGDGSDDVAVYREGTGPGGQSTWYYRTTAGGPVFAMNWGQTGDFPAPGDYDGDGSADFYIQRNGGAQGHFWGRTAAGAVSVTPFGLPSDVIVPGDYDGDGKTDIAVARAVSGQIAWYYLPSSGGGFVSFFHGASATDFPAQGDYNGDGRTDAAIWRQNADFTQNFFFIRNSATAAVSTFEWGQQGDYPVANYNTH